MNTRIDQLFQSQTIKLQPKYPIFLEGFASDSKVSGRPLSLSPNPLIHKDLVLRGIRVIYSKSVKRINLERTIVGKIIFFREKVTVQDIIILFDNLLWLQEKASSDPLFQQKFGNSLEELALKLKKWKIGQSLNHKTLENLRLDLIEMKSFYIPERHIKHHLALIQGKTEIRNGAEPGKSTKDLPSPRFIGVGYRDKGTARDLAFDGSPTWKEYLGWALWREKEVE